MASSLALVSASLVTWISARADGSSRALVQAPLDVAELMYDGVFADSVAVLTSATLKLGGEFTALAQSVGLAGTRENSVLRTVDVGSPFDYPGQGILYVARQIPRPGQGGVDAKVYEHLAELIEAAGGRTLGLFSSMRSAEQAAQYCREHLDFPILCQSEAQLSKLTADFLAGPGVCLFGTLSLWQGIDVPGDTCNLVVIDRIPFPRPDDPLIRARSRYADEMGGNGFMDVSVAHAGLLLAQGSGRLIRTLDDRGVVAVLDSRLANARYAEYLRACMPDFWPTTDTQTVLDVLRRLNAAANAKEA
ncbi:MAG: ATP-dependent DNA helicase, partial [Propionibacteriaceae bacterium]|jgi:ATP-dependent DNA helicase DinG|nr:ATP-dependent DNA helicase [Propionibacteriaceae bacterium]